MAWMLIYRAWITSPVDHQDRAAARSLALVEAQSFTAAALEVVGPALLPRQRRHYHAVIPLRLPDLLLI